MTDKTSLLATSITIRDLVMVVPLAAGVLYGFFEIKSDLRAVNMRVDVVENSRTEERLATREWRRRVDGKLDTLLSRRAEITPEIDRFQAPL